MKKDKKILKELTIVIPTYCRQKFAIRNMKYWSNRGPKVIVLDGSQKPIEKRYLKYLGNNIRYIHSPSLILDRLDLAMDLIDTEYVCTLGDDEFFLPSGLEASIAELDSNSLLFACMGRAIGFGIHNGNHISGFDVYPKLNGYSIEQSRPAERMFHHMQEYVPSTIYSVIRTEVWKSAISSLLVDRFQVYGVDEIRFELAISYLGRSKIIPYLHWLRSTENAQITDSRDSGLNKKRIFYKSWLSEFEDGQTFRQEFIKSTSKTLSKFDSRDQSEVAIEVEHAVNAYVKGCQRKIDSVSNIQKIKLFLLKYLPPSIIQKIRLFKSRKKVIVGMIEFAQSLSIQGVRVDFGELKEIEKELIEFYRYI